MADRYIEHIVVSSNKTYKVVLDNGDTLQGVVNLDLPQINANWYPVINMRVLIFKERSDDG